MLEQFDLGRNNFFERWYLDVSPASITIHNLKTGKQLREPSLVAMSFKKEELSQPDLYTGEKRTVARMAPEKLTAAGRAALEYQNAPDTVVFSPFRQGQIIHFTAAELLLKALLNQAGPKLLVPKPVMCVHIQEHTTQVEKQALAEAALQAGARKVFFYSEPLPAMLDGARRFRELQNAVLIHIDPQDGKE